MEKGGGIIQQERIHTTRTSALTSRRDSLVGTHWASVLYPILPFPLRHLSFNMFFFQNIPHSAMLYSGAILWSIAPLSTEIAEQHSLLSGKV